MNYFSSALQGDEDLERITLFCMPGMKWYPSAERVYCTESCNTKLLDDGICDCKQNNKHCKYDGGDCCALTLKWSNIVIYRDNALCDCIDPVVIEAQSQEASGDGDTFKQGYEDNEEGNDEDDFGKKFEVMHTFT